MSVAAFIGVAIAHLLAAISPGPSFVLQIRTAASDGFRPAAGLALGFGIGAVVWAAAALLGLALVFEVLPPLFIALKIGGGLFLLWLGVQMWRHAREPLPTTLPDQPPRGMMSAIRLGTVTQLANPKPAIFFGAVFVGLVPLTATLGEKAIVLFNIMWVETAWYLLTARLFSLAGPKAVYAGAKAWLDRGMGTILGALGVRVALT